MTTAVVPVLLVEGELDVVRGVLAARAAPVSRQAGGERVGVGARSVGATYHDGPRPLTQFERRAAVDAPQDDVDARFFATVTDLVGARGARRRNGIGRLACPLQALEPGGDPVSVSAAGRFRASGLPIRAR